jgi:nucleotide-binding universal stress UspA family protein
MSSPAIIGFDGSEAAAHAVKTVRPILATGHAVVVTVFEPALVALGGFDTNLGGGTMEMNLETAQIIEQANEDHAQRVGEQGAELARKAGFATVEVQAIRDEANVAETLARIAQERGAGAIVLGSHGHGAVRTRLLGSTATKLMSRSHCPVVVIPPAQSEEG